MLIPQIPSPSAFKMLAKPFSPHPVPQEFLTIQELVSEVYPTKVIAWFKATPQFSLLNTPELYN